MKPTKTKTDLLPVCHPRCRLPRRRLAMVFKLVESAQARWRAVNGALFERGQLIERPETVAA